MQGTSADAGSVGATLVVARVGDPAACVARRRATTRVAPTSPKALSSVRRKRRFFNGLQTCSMRVSTPGWAADVQGTSADAGSVGATLVVARVGDPAACAARRRATTRVAPTSPKALSSDRRKRRFFNGLQIFSMRVSTPGRGADAQGTSADAGPIGATLVVARVGEPTACAARRRATTRVARVVYRPSIVPTSPPPVASHWR